MPLSFWKDLKEKGLAPIKILLFLQAAGDMALYPFLTLHMKYLGITVTEIGIQFALTPVATLLATPLVGLLADKIGNFKIMLSISLMLVAGLSQLFILVPPAIDHINLPKGAARLSCAPGSHRHLFMDVSRNWTLDSKTFSNGTFESSQSVGLNVSLKRCSWVCNDPPVSEMCFSSAPGKDRCVVLNTTNTLFVSLNRHGGGESDRWRVGQAKLDKDSYDQVFCHTRDSSCSGECEVRLDEIAIADPSRRQLTFWSYLALRILLYVIIATEMSLLKAATLTTIDKYDSEYGFQRIWANISSCITPLLTGLLMDRLQNGEVEDYNPCFYIFGGMKLVMAILTLFVDLTAKPPTLDIWLNVTKLFKNPEVCIMLVYVTFVGSCWGYLETFLFWYLETLGASKFLMGMTFTIGSATGIVTSIFAGAIERRISHIPIIAIGLFAYAVRFVGYTYIINPYHALIFEALECLTMSLMLIVITTYANKLASMELVATMQATWAALHFAVGRALGSLIGGFMIDALGSLLTYRIYAIKCVFMGTLYLLLYFFWLRKRKSPGEEDEKVREDAEKPCKGEFIETYKYIPEIIKFKENDVGSLHNEDTEKSKNYNQSKENSKNTQSDEPEKEKLEMSNMPEGLDNKTFQIEDEVQASEKQETAH